MKSSRIFHTLVVLPGAISSDITDFSANLTTIDKISTAPISFAAQFLKYSLGPPSATIESFEWAGSGCSNSTSLYADYDDKSGAFQYYTPRFSVFSGSDSFEPTDSRKHCTVSFTLGYPNGWQFSLGGAESKGYAGISAGNALVQGSYWFSGISGTERWESSLEGPMHEEWYAGYKANEDRGLWSACGESNVLNVQMSNYRRPSTDPGVVLLEWTNLYLRWKACKQE